MNAALAYETSLATVVRQFADIGGDTHIRVWRNLQWDHRWQPDEDRHMPCVDIRAGIADPGNDQHTLSLEGQVQMYTNSADDQNHALVGKMEEQIQGVLDKLFYGALSNDGNDELTLFAATMTDLCGSDYHFGGFTVGSGIMPMDESGFNVVGLSLLLHYTRSDY